MKAGSLRWFDETGEHVVSPGEPMFSTALMLATEFWNGTEWETI